VRSASGQTVRVMSYGEENGSGPEKASRVLGCFVCPKRLVEREMLAVAERRESVGSTFTVARVE